MRRLLCFVFVVLFLPALALGVPHSDWAAGVSRAEKMAGNDFVEKDDTPVEKKMYANIYEYAARSLAHMTSPDWGKVGKEVLKKAFASAFRSRETWLKKFKTRIHELSGGDVALEEASENLPFEALPPGKVFVLKRKSDEARALVIIGPYYTPIVFWE